MAVAAILHNGVMVQLWWRVGRCGCCHNYPLCKDSFGSIKTGHVRGHTQNYFRFFLMRDIVNIFVLLLKNQGVRYFRTINLDSLTNVRADMVVGMESPYYTLTDQSIYLLKKGVVFYVLF